MSETLMIYCAVCGMRGAGVDASYSSATWNLERGESSQAQTTRVNPKARSRAPILELDESAHIHVQASRRPTANDLNLL